MVHAFWRAPFDPHLTIIILEVVTSTGSTTSRTDPEHNTKIPFDDFVTALVKPCHVEKHGDARDSFLSVSVEVAGLLDCSDNITESVLINRINHRVKKLLDIIIAAKLRYCRTPL